MRLRCRPQHEVVPDAETPRIGVSASVVHVLHQCTERLFGAATERHRCDPGPVPVTTRHLARALRAPIAVFRLLAVALAVPVWLIIVPLVDLAAGVVRWNTRRAPERGPSALIDTGASTDEPAKVIPFPRTRVDRVHPSRVASRRKSA